MPASGPALWRLGQPNPKQREFFLARSRFVAYGGARGGGKSWAVRKKAVLLAARHAGIRILLLRRSFPELRENHILPLMEELQDIALYRETQKAFLFPNGSRLRFGYCDAESDVLQYQGQEYDVIFLDEATQFTEYQFHTLTACLRGANRHPKRMYLTCNPGGVGHEWVKRLFVDRDYRGGERGGGLLLHPRAGVRQRGAAATGSGLCVAAGEPAAGAAPRLAGGGLERVRRAVLQGVLGRPARG